MHSGLSFRCQVVFVLSLFFILLSKNGSGQCPISCSVTADSYTINLACEKGGISEKVNDQQKFEYASSGGVAAIVITVNHERTYNTSKRTYHIGGTIRLDQTSGTAIYDIQVTGGLIGKNPAVCKSTRSLIKTPNTTASTSRKPASPADFREPIVNLRVAANYQPAIIVPVCANALKESQAPTFACLVSDPGEYIGRGKTWLLPSENPPASAAVIYERVRVSVPDADGKFDFSFSIPKESSWKVGLLDDAVRDGFHDEKHPGLDISGHSSGCSEISGRFELLELVTGPDGRSVQKFAANFEQLCSGKRLQGIVRFNSVIDR
jgi:hypothetical protein